MTDQQVESESAVAQFDPKTAIEPVASESVTAPVRFSASALAHVRLQLEKQGVVGVRLGVKKSGCSGYMYTLDWAKEAKDDDLVFEVEKDVKVFIAKDELPLIEGTELDFVTEGLNSTMKFKHPGAKSMCGCGESFGF